jgi:glyoxylase-like metal-dependent hydrolase (beta-lactamase superfamily II)
VDRPVVRVIGGVKEGVALFLVEHRGVLSIVDTGTDGSAKRILRALRKAGRRPDEVRQIVLTHCHGDHTGAARRLKEATGAIVVAGAADVGVIEGRAPYPGPPKQPFAAVYAGLSRFPRLQVDRPVEGRTELEGGLVALPAPGHTAGHMVVLAPDLDSIFAGDIVFHLGPLRPSWRGLTQDPERNAESIREIAAIGAGRIVPGHGPPVSGDRLRALARRLPG